MSLIYSILKPILRKASAGRAVMTREDFVRQAEIEPDTFHAYPAFTFTPEGRRGEQQVIDFIREKLSR